MHFTANYRKDNLSSDLSEIENEYSSISFGWNAKNEKLLRDVNAISALFFRSSFGKAGNTRHDYQEYFYYNFLGTGITEYFDKFYTEDTKCENYGFEIGLYKNRFLFSMDIYKKTVDGMLLPSPSNGLSNNYFYEYSDLVKQQNNGIECNLQLQIVDNESFKWRSAANYFKNEYKTEISNEDLQFEYNFVGNFAGYFGGYVNAIGDGYNYGDFYLPCHASIDDEYGILYYNQEGALTTHPENARRKVQGNAFPDFELGWSNHWEFFSKFYLDLRARAVVGHDIYNGTRMYSSNMFLLQTYNIPQDVLDEFGDYESLASKISSLFLEKASFYKIDNITIGYKLPAKTLKFVQQAEFYLGANNLITITDYKGVDPEVSYQRETAGIDNFSIYPPIRSFFIGCKLRF